jgi:hypothetical protein
MDPTDIGLWRDFLSAARCVWRILIIASEYRHPKLMSCTSPSPEPGQSSQTSQIYGAVKRQKSHDYIGLVS